jgi:putative hydrolase of the HAD superfamily
MALKLAAHCLATRSLATARALRLYRKEREKIADEEVENFEAILLQRVSADLGDASDALQAIVQDWIERRPLPLLQSCRYPDVAEFFESLRASGRTIGVLSDYPAREKLAALDLHADFVVGANDESVRLLKPHPRGLEHAMAIAGVLRGETILIGDRPERDGAAGARAGVATFILSRRNVPGSNCFRSYADLRRSLALA